MKKKIFGIKIGTVLTWLFCLIAAVLFWLFVKYSDVSAAQLFKCLRFDFRGLI